MSGWQVWPGYEMVTSDPDGSGNPPKPVEFYRPHIFQMRGKAEGKEIRLQDLGPPLLDVELRPGEILYVPRGFIHATSTEMLSYKHRGETSLHLTMNLETALMRQTYEGMLVCTYSLLAEALPSITPDTFLKMWQMVAVDESSILREELPLGFLARLHLNHSATDAAKGGGWEASTVVTDMMVARMRHLMAQIGPPIGLTPAHFTHEPSLKAHIPAIDTVWQDVAARFVTAHKDHVDPTPDYSRAPQCPPLPKPLPKPKPKP